MLSGCVAAVLAYTGDTAWAVVLTTIAAAITSWSEFSDVSRKAERYNRALVELANLHSGWFNRMCSLCLWQLPLPMLEPCCGGYTHASGHSLAKLRRQKWLNSAPQPVPHTAHRLAMSEVEKAITINISRFVHSVEAVISDERGNASHEHTTTGSQKTHMAPSRKQLHGCRRRTRMPCTAPKMEPRKTPRKMPGKAPKKAPRTASRMAQG